MPDDPVQIKKNLKKEGSQVLPAHRQALRLHAELYLDRRVFFDGYINESASLNLIKGEKSSEKPMKEKHNTVVNFSASADECQADILC